MRRGAAPQREEGDGFVALAPIPWTLTLSRTTLIRQRMMDQVPSPEVPIGTVLAGKYRVERVLGQGGMGVVVAARHLHLDQTVAIKLLRRDRTADTTAVERFLREARAAACIESEHVARVFDVGILDSGTPFIVMEHLAGTDLASKSSRSTSPSDVVDWVLQACEAIAEAHLRGIVHRDLKPSNLFLTDRVGGRPVVKVLDFGIAKALGSQPDEERALQTQTLAVMGTPRYMSPEQMRSAKHVDARTDIWALGAILFELLTGRPAFDGESLPELCSMVAVDPVPSLCDLRPDIPEGLERAIRWCMEKSPDDRPQTVAQLAAALAPFGSDEASAAAARIERVMGVGSATMVTGDTPAADAPDTATGWGATASGPARSKPWLAVAAVLATIVLGAGGAVWWFATPGSDGTSTAESAPLAASSPAAFEVASPPASVTQPESADPRDSGPTASASASATPAQRPPQVKNTPPSTQPAASQPVRGKPPQPVPSTPASDLDDEPLLDRQ